MVAVIHHFYPPTFSRLFASASAPENLAGMLNIMGAHFDVQTSDTQTMGVVSVPLIRKRLVFVLTIEEGYTGGETMDLSVKYLDTEGNDVVVATGQLNAVDTPIAGTYEGERDVPDIPAGRVLQLVRDYQPGPGPKQEQMSLVIQVF